MLVPGCGRDGSLRDAWKSETKVSPVGQLPRDRVTSIGPQTNGRGEGKSGGNYHLLSSAARLALYLPHRNSRNNPARYLSITVSVPLICFRPEAFGISDFFQIL